MTPDSKYQEKKWEVQERGTWEEINSNLRDKEEEF